MSTMNATLVRMLLKGVALPEGDTCLPVSSSFFLLEYLIHYYRMELWNIQVGVAGLV